MSNSRDLDEMGSWDPMQEDYTSASFNSYDRGPGARFPNGLSPASRNSGDGERSQSEHGNINLYVAGIPLEMEEDGVKHFFGRVAMPVAVHIKKPQDYSRGTTYCFVHMASVKDADAVMREFDNQMCGKFRLTVRPSKSVAQKQRREQSETPYSSNSREPQQVKLYASQEPSQRKYSQYDGGSQKDSRPQQPPIRTMENRYGKSSPHQAAMNRDPPGRGDSPPPLDVRPPSPGRSRSAGSSPSPVGTRRSHSSERLDRSGPAELGTFADKYSQFRGSMAGPARSPHQQGQSTRPDDSGRRQSLSPQHTSHMDHRVPYGGSGVRRSQSQSNIRERQPSGEYRTSPTVISQPEGRGRDRTPVQSPGQQGTYVNGIREEHAYARQKTDSPGVVTPQHASSVEKPLSSSPDRAALPCLLCGQAGKSRCARCKKPYCSKECQRNHWPEHKNYCRPVEKSESATGFENFDVSAGEDVKEKMDALIALAGIQVPADTPQSQQPSAQQAAPPPELTVANMEQAKLPKDDTVHVLVTDVVSPENICVQIVSETLGELNQLMADMAQTYQGTANEGPSAYHPQPGELCAGMFSDGGWYRASVDSVNPDATLAVTYVDYGNTENIPVARVRKLDSRMTKLPLLAVRCSLVGLAGMGGSTWDVEVVNFLRAKVLNKQCSVTMKKEEEDGTAQVEMMETDTGKSVTQMVLESGLFTPFQKPPLPPPDPQEEFAFLVTHIDSPASFYGQVGQGSDMEMGLADLKKQIATIAGLPGAISDKQEPYAPRLGELCCALWEKDKDWYRAVVMEIMSETQLKVYFLDYGNTEVVTTGNTRPIPDDFAKYPGLALHCMLAGVLPLTSDQPNKWSTQATSCFKAMAVNLLQGRPVTRDGDVLVVELKNFATGASLSEEMIGAGAAGPPAVTPASSASPHKSVDEFSRSPSPRLHSRSPSSPAMTSSSVASTSSSGVQAPSSAHSSPQKLSSSSPYQQIPQLQPVPPSRPGSAKKGRLPTVTRVQPPTSGKIDMLLKCVKSPGLFYCQLTEPSGVQDLQMLLREMIHYCQALPVDPAYCPDIGEICCVNSPDGRSWLRAQVQEHRVSNKVQIECVDIGKTVLVSQNRLRPAQPQHMDLPLQVFKARLAGVVPVHGGEWSKQATDFVAKYVDSQRLTAQVVGQEGDCYVLDIWDQSSGQENSLSMLLCEEGLAHLEPMTPNSSPPLTRKQPPKTSQPQAIDPTPVQNGHVIGANPVEVVQNGSQERTNKEPSLAEAVGTAGGTELITVPKTEWQEMKNLLLEQKNLLLEQQKQLSHVCGLLEHLLLDKRS